jgi:hypothetical protein
MSKFKRLNLQAPNGEEFDLMSGHFNESGSGNGNAHYRVRFDAELAGNDLPARVEEPSDLLGWTCIITTVGLNNPEVIPERGTLTISGTSQKVRNWSDYWVLTVPKSGPLVP